MTGKNIRQSNDPLLPVSTEKVWQALTTSNSDLHRLVDRLRLIKVMDVAQYRILKTSLPYLVCGQFHPATRRKEHFVNTTYFFLDVDHLAEAGFSPENLKAKIAKDKRVHVAFVSPGNDGLKLLFRLNRKVDDIGYYSVFYRKFAMLFATEYGLEMSIDLKTSDVSRCCFMSHDPTAYFSPNPQEVNPDDYIDPHQINELDRHLGELKMFEKTLFEKQKGRSDAEQKATSSGPDSDTLAIIKEKLLTIRRQKPEKEIMQPEELKNVVALIETLVTEAGLNLLKSTPISYGKQLQIGTSKQWAEINIFFGKRGVSIVPTTRTGSNKELASSITEMLRTHF